MPRSARYPFLQQLLNAASEARLTDEQLERRISRRSFLKSSAIVTGITAIDLVMPPISWSQRKGKPKIVIVGAGLAGLTAAYELRKKKIIAEVYEANSRIGGRVLTTRDQFGPGLYTEFGGEFIDTGHSEVFRLARELNLGMIDVEPESNANLQALMYFEGKHHSREELTGALRPILERISRDAEAVDLRNSELFRQLDKTTLESYIDSLSCEPWLKSLLKVAFVIEYGRDANEQSALNMLSMIDTDLGDSKFEMYGESDERYRINGGNDLLPKSIAAKFEDDIKLGCWLESIRKKGNGYQLSFKKGQGNVEVNADMVIITIPFSVLRDVEIDAGLPAMKKQVIQQLQYGHNSKIIFGIKKQNGLTPWESMKSNGQLFTDLSAQSGWDSAPRQSLSDSSFTAFLGGSKASIGAASAEKALWDLGTVMPNFFASYNGISKTFEWANFSFSKGSYACYAPGQWSMQGEEGKPVGDLYFAGEHCSADYQGFMNGAVETGASVAKTILKKIKA